MPRILLFFAVKWIVICIALAANYGVAVLFSAAIAPFIALTFGTVIGIPLGISGYGMVFLVSAIASIALFVIGIRHRAHTAGQFAASSGLLAWIVLAMLGLGLGG